ncbi:MAG: hypothetical protein J3K34DRAFT_437722 [Monoraphidium minutum]|nr:MAG: hypothetical protein J3K34DRAFT_437722 [Monoraphidium minutum]
MPTWGGACGVGWGGSGWKVRQKGPGGGLMGVSDSVFCIRHVSNGALARLQAWPRAAMPAPGRQNAGSLRKVCARALPQGPRLPPGVRSAPAGPARRCARRRRAGRGPPARGAASAHAWVLFLEASLGGGGRAPRLQWRCVWGARGCVKAQALLSCFAQCGERRRGPGPRRPHRRLGALFRSCKGAHVAGCVEWPKKAKV